MRLQIKPKKDMEDIARLFSDWEETMIWSCLEGYMGYVLTDGKISPETAAVFIGDFCFFGGKADASLIEQADMRRTPILVPGNKEWGDKIRACMDGKVTRHIRYAMKKEPDIFDTEKLKEMAERIPESYELGMIREGAYNQALSMEWSKDLCSQFPDYETYKRMGIGVAAFTKASGRLVAGASSYTVYSGGIEIEIDTHEEHRRQGLARACGARLILECLERGLYPSWDAHNQMSARLAEQLGYHLDGEYETYIRVDERKE